LKISLKPNPQVQLLVQLTAQSADVASAASINPIQIVLLLVLLAISGFLSGSETSFTAVGQWKIRQLREEGHSVFALLEKDTTRFITTCLIGSNLANIGATALITFLVKLRQKRLLYIMQNLLHVLLFALSISYLKFSTQ